MTRKKFFTSLVFAVCGFFGIKSKTGHTFGAPVSREKGELTDRERAIEEWERGYKICESISGLTDDGLLKDYYDIGRVSNDLLYGGAYRYKKVYLRGEVVYERIYYVPVAWGTVNGNQFRIPDIRTPRFP